MALQHARESFENPTGSCPFLFYCSSFYSLFLLYYIIFNCCVYVPRGPHHGCDEKALATICVQNWPCET